MVGSPNARARRAVVDPASLFLLVLAVLVATPLFAQVPELSEQALERLPEPRETVRAGIAELSGENLSAEARVAAVTFPRLLYESLAGIAERDLSARERTAYASLRLAEAVRAASSRLRSAVDARDRLLFETGADDAATARRLTAETAVTEARSVYDELSVADPELIPTAPVRPLEYWSGHEEGRLLAAASDPDARAELAVAEDLDIVLWGTVLEVEGYLVVDLFLYHRFLGSDEPAGGTVARPEDLGLDAAIVGGEAAASILGRPFATLEIVTDDPEASVSVGGVLRGFGDVRVPHLRPGEQRVVVRADGRPAVERMVTLVAGEQRVERVELPDSSARVVRIQSSPAGADVYVDSVWVGTTPMAREFPGGSTIIRLRREGYLESRFVVDGASPPVMNRALLPASVDWSEEIRQRRDDFYQALTLFVVSVPVTVLLNGGYESIRGVLYAPDSAQLTQDESFRLVRFGNIFYWSSLGGVLVNAGLFVNLLISIFDYVEVGEGSHNQ